MTKTKSATPRKLAAKLMAAAYRQALKSYREGGLPIGAVLATRQGKIVARGHNLRVQTGDPTAHGEVVCIRNAGRRRDWRDLVLVSTLSPCIMCTGTTLLYRITRVIIGENTNFRGAEKLFREHGVKIENLRDKRCIALMKKFRKEQPDLWAEDIGD